MWRIRTSHSGWNLRPLVREDNAVFYWAVKTDQYWFNSHSQMDETGTLTQFNCPHRLFVTFKLNLTFSCITEFLMSSWAYGTSQKMQRRHFFSPFVLLMALLNLLLESCATTVWYLSFVVKIWIKILSLICNYCTWPSTSFRCHLNTIHMRRLCT